MTPGPAACGAQAARTVLRNFSTSLLRLRLSFESERADASTCAEAEPVALAPVLTWVIFSATSAVPLAASLTLRAISAVAAPCSSMVAAMVVEMSEILEMVAPISLMAPTDPRRRLHAGDLRADLVGGLGRLGRQRLHFAGHYRKASAGFAGARGFDGGVQRQQVGLFGDRGDQLDDVADPARGLEQFIDAVVGMLGLLHGLAGDAAGIREPAG